MKKSQNQKVVKIVVVVLGVQEIIDILNEIVLSKITLLENLINLIN